VTLKDLLDQATAFPPECLTMPLVIDNKEITGTDYDTQIGCIRLDTKERTEVYSMKQRQQRGGDLFLKDKDGQLELF